MSENMIMQFELIQEIGKSTTSIVYKAYDSENSRKVRIKKLIPSDSIKRDIIKIKSYVGIEHPNLSTVHAVEKVENTYIIVSDYFEGDTLQHLLLTNHYSREVCFHILLQFSNGLAALHRNNLYHGNLKLSNILLDKNNKAVLVDCGLSPFEDFQNSPEFYAPYMASHFLSPEQVHNEPVSLQTDFFVLGIIAYRLFLHNLPFTGENEELLLQSIAEERPDFSKIGEGSQNRLIKLFLGKLLSKEKSYRFTNSTELIATLEEIIHCDETLKQLADDVEPMSNPRKYLIVSVILFLFMVFWVAAAFIYNQ